ncbi:hypothetical protein VOLCADRAFT_103566 [Volvox carteri f. nagariensis]|uniref:Uncharacterized protein n=1 Tax=Volvox carteri f. nagariensis TaxID=3068 RepID=D8TMU1_VOLCA|nr:uncharacterized protein VOLCADRAFT_103566 [Volvox carteri f. nagariensis]EFJ51312.1 hypothetical protein VOLCADRAFT_103566 [Volvox carteri f. nagariensis]|eukprot:XP_002947779.1 hypothetical protein VOLCADRAFT_103566 [Volvox carteri f. nagariensis]
MVHRIIEIGRDPPLVNAEMCQDKIAMGLLIFWSGINYNVWCGLQHTNINKTIEQQRQLQQQVAKVQDGAMRINPSTGGFGATTGSAGGRSIPTPTTSPPPTAGSAPAGALLVKSVMKKSGFAPLRPQMAEQQKQQLLANQLEVLVSAAKAGAAAYRSLRRLGGTTTRGGAGQLDSMRREEDYGRYARDEKRRR